MDNVDIFHEEDFDDYSVIINGYKRQMRLTIFKYSKRWRRHVIVFQADASGVLCLKKLKNLISEFRYDFIQEEYICLDK